MKCVSECLALLFVLSAAAANGQVIYNTSSTASEGYSRGIGSIINVDNQVKSVNAFWEKKDIYSEHQQQEMAIVQQKRQRYIERRGSLDLSPEEFDRTTGQITWPKILEQKQYDAYRNALDELFHKRSYNGALTGDEYIEATTALNDWRATLLKQKSEYPGSILEQMLRFQLKVKRELDDNLS
jgi:hypothetical protein